MESHAKCVFVSCVAVYKESLTVATAIERLCASSTLTV